MLYIFDLAQFEGVSTLFYLPDATAVSRVKRRCFNLIGSILPFINYAYICVSLFATFK